MPIDDPRDLERVDQEIRINELKHKAEELAGGEMTTWESEACPPGLSEQFWRHVVDYESAPLTCEFDRLTEQGVELPEPESMTDEQLTAKLWEVIERLAAMRVFLSNTNHLSDRELYADLWSDLLREMNPLMPYDENSAYHIDPLGGCSEEDIHQYMKYYADDEYRSRWQKDWPDYEMPPHEVPPYDRDRLLPQARY